MRIRERWTKTRVPGTSKSNLKSSCIFTLQFVVLFVALLLQPVNSQTVVQPEKVELDLESMTNKELEEICTSRGFELNKELDEDTGNEYEFSHDDYVEAAKQCLAVEKEMGEILAENPELLDELKEEVDAMNAEKARLEKELAEAQKKQGDSKVSTDQSVKAFIPPANRNEQTDDGIEQNATATAADATPLADASNATMNATEEEKIEERAPDVNTDDTPEGPQGREKTPSVDATEKVGAPLSGETEEERASTTTSAEKSNIASPLETSVDSTTPAEMSFQEEFISIVRNDLIRVRNKLQAVLNMVLPEQFRKPLKIVLARVLHYGKEGGKTLFDLLNRYVRALVTKAKEKRIEAKERKEAAEAEATEEQSTTAMDEALSR